MKRLLFGAILALICTAFMSCDKCSTDGKYVDQIQYSLKAQGQAEGDLTVTFPQGQFDMDGVADLKFEIHSQDSLLQATNGIALNTAVKSIDLEQQKAALQVQQEIDKIAVKSANGNYYVHIVGFAKEPITGLVFAIDKTYTNRQLIKP